jgi:hypothetical protein
LTTPIFSSGARFDSGTPTVTVSTATPGAEIYYTINTTTPMTSSRFASSAFYFVEFRGESG